MYPLYKRVIICIAIFLALILFFYVVGPEKKTTVQSVTLPPPKSEYLVYLESKIKGMTREEVEAYSLEVEKRNDEWRHQITVEQFLQNKTYMDNGEELLRNELQRRNLNDKEIQRFFNLVPEDYLKSLKR